ncbi:phthiocerol/phthiodiolone dimycocerosyl transferase family protein [Nocardia acidivorans]|uniref:phthiocerol/phthiodiolone dimycocerosyl transferase family protein n=1 Tax=Nocardia acidivorans TaxID=404580 RepID=UPI000837A4D4|nr:hypothetical protein [Nocardia acidivorans]
MTTTVSVRPLAPSELGFTRAEVYVGYSVLVAGSLELARLALAFDAVRTRNPILRAALLPRDGARFDITAPAEPRWSMTVVHDDPARAPVEVETDQYRALGVLHVVRGWDRTRVILLTHHSIADARHSLALLGELWWAYGDPEGGAAALGAMRGYPHSVETLLTGAPPEPHDAPAVEPVPRQGSRALHTDRAHLSVARTAALIDYTRMTGLTVNSVASAAILLAESRIRGVPLTALRYLYAVDLRSRLRPSVGATGGTNVIGFADYRARVERSGLLELAADVAADLQRQLAAGDIERTALHGPDPAVPGVELVRATNWGPIPPFPEPPGLTLSDFRAAMTVNPPDFPAPPRPGAVPPGEYVMHTADGRLSIEFLTRPGESAASARRRVDLLGKILNELG